MISAFVENSSSEIVQINESYEFQPLGGVLARYCDDTLWLKRPSKKQRKLKRNKETFMAKVKAEALTPVLEIRFRSDQAGIQEMEMESNSGKRS